jgi:hypothetical protein
MSEIVLTRRITNHSRKWWQFWKPNTVTTRLHIAHSTAVASELEGVKWVPVMDLRTRPTETDDE